MLTFGRESSIFKASGLRFYFFSREEERPHVLQGPRGEAKFWLEPEIALAQDYGLGRRYVTTALRLIREHENEIRAAWKKHFRR